MDLKVFKEKNKLHQSLIVCGILLVLLIVVVVVFRTYALFETRETYDVIQGEVPSYIDNFDVKVALTIDGVTSTNIPDKGSGKAIECDKGAIGAFENVMGVMLDKSSKPIVNEIIYLILDSKEALVVRHVIQRVETIQVLQV